MPSLPDGSVSAIVTDPPWGEHEDLGMPYIKFADAMMRNFDRVLDRRRGRLVLLVSRREGSTVTGLWEPSGLEVQQTHEILVNGHPATVLVGGRTPSLRVHRVPGGTAETSIPNDTRSDRTTTPSPMIDDGASPVGNDDHAKPGRSRSTRSET